MGTGTGTGLVLGPLGTGTAAGNWELGAPVICDGPWAMGYGNGNGRWLYSAWHYLGVGVGVERPYSL
jgi:hypothetical protein